MTRRGDELVHLTEREKEILNLLLRQTAMGERLELAVARLENQVSRWLADFVDEHAHRRYYLAERVGGEVRKTDADGSGRVSVSKISAHDGGDGYSLTSEYDVAAVRKAQSLAARNAADDARVEEMVERCLPQIDAVVDAVRALVRDELPK